MLQEWFRIYSLQEVHWFFRFLVYFELVRSMEYTLNAALAALSEFQTTEDIAIPLGNGFSVIVFRIHLQYLLLIYQVAPRLRMVIWFSVELRSILRVFNLITFKLTNFDLGSHVILIFQSNLSDTHISYVHFVR